MKAFLLYKDKDYIPGESKESFSDLWFETIINNICIYDKAIKDIYLDASNLMTTDSTIIKYREDILKDFIRNKNIMINLYSFISDLLVSFYNNRYEIQTSKATESVLACVRILPDLLLALENINRYFNAYKDLFKSEGLNKYINNYLNTFTIDFITNLTEVFELCSFKKGIFTISMLDETLTPSNYMIYDVTDKIKEEKSDGLKQTGIQLRSKISTIPRLEYIIKEHLEWKRVKPIASPRAVASTEESFQQQTDEALLNIAPKLCSVIDDIVNYLRQTKIEMAFYIGGVNLYDKLMNLNLPICNPIISNKKTLKCKGLYDLALALKSNGNVIGNEINIDNKDIIFISGANQGGKTTFLRSYGQAIIMMQLGLFVAGESFESNTFNNIFTHFNKEEDKSMTSGKLDEELSRLNNMIDNMTKNSLVLFNESFQSTSEIEGSNIAFDIVKALKDKGISTVMVSHMYHLYNLFEKNLNDDVAYLRASREEDGTRNYKLISEKPLKTSFATDIYKEIFGD